MTWSSRKTRALYICADHHVVSKQMPDSSRFPRERWRATGNFQVKTNTMRIMLLVMNSRRKKNKNKIKLTKLLLHMLKSIHLLSVI